MLASGPGFNIVDMYIETPVSYDASAGATFTADFVADNVADNNTAFSLQNAMVVAGEYVLLVRGAPFPYIDVKYPSASGGSSYNGSYLEVDGLDRWDWDVMLHEYGHYVADLLNIEANPGGVHSVEDNLSDARGSKAVGIPLAFGEGWPTYFAVSALQTMNTAALSIPNVGDTEYQDTEDQVLTEDLEAGGTLGEDNEVTVMSTLWDLYDTADDGIDRVTLGSPAVWTMLDNGDPTTLSAAYRLFAPAPATVSDGVNCVFSQLNVSPRIAGPAISIVGPGAASPVVSWSRGNGGTHANNRFEVQYRDRTDGVLLHTSGVITGTTYTAPTAAWTAAVGGSGGFVGVTVIGNQIDPPATGPYRSCRQLLDVRSTDVTINQATGQADPSGADPIHFTAVFNRPVSGFTAGDVTVGGTAAPTTAVVAEVAPLDGTTYDVAVSGMSGAGTVMAAIPANSAQDGIGGLNTESTSSDDTVTFTVPIADLTVAKSHAGSFALGQTGATYRLVVSNAGNASSSGAVTVADTLPAGLAATAITGSGWTCTLGTLSCSRADALAAGASHPAVTVTVTVASNAAAAVINTASVSGGGESNTTNNAAVDSTTVTAPVRARVQLVRDPYRTGKLALQVTGTLQSDDIRLEAAARGGILVVINRVRRGVYRPTGMIIVRGLDGNDVIAVEAGVRPRRLLDGGAGNDRLLGGAGRGILVGGKGDDRIEGGAARDILIGGAGGDSLRAGAGGDILIAGASGYDDLTRANQRSLAAILAEWTRLNGGYWSRIGHLGGATGGGLNGRNRLRSGVSVFDDAEKDTLSGSRGRDWFFLNRPAPGAGRDVSDRRANERATGL